MIPHLMLETRLQDEAVDFKTKTETKSSVKWPSSPRALWPSFCSFPLKLPDSDKDESLSTPRHRKLPFGGAAILSSQTDCHLIQ